MEGGHRRSHARDEEEGRQRWGGAGKHTHSRGPRGRGEGAAQEPENTGTQPGHQENQRGIPPPPTHGGGPATPGTPAAPGHPRSGPHTPAPPPPGPACHPPTFLHPSVHPIHPSVLNRSVFHQRLTPRRNILGTHSRARRPRPGPHNTATGCGSGARAGTTGASSSPRLRGWGSRGQPGVAPRTFPPSPWARTTGAGRAHTAHTRPPHSPDTRRGPAGPSPNSEGGRRGPQ